MKKTAKKLKRALACMLAVVLLVGVAPIADIGSTVIKASAVLSLSQLQEKYPDGKYWNHAGNPGSSNSVNNQDGYTSTPCSVHGVVGTSRQTCNGFAPDGTQLSWQCMGYAEKLGYDSTGYNPRNNANGWSTSTSPSALDRLKAGDIVRYKDDGHSIFVTAVNGDTVTYTDCNSDGHCIIRWGATISKSILRSSLTHVRSAPCELSNGHTHTYSDAYESDHPHRKYKKCDCGDYYYTGEDAATYYTFYEADHPHKDYVQCEICGKGYYTGSTTYVDSCSFCQSLDSSWDFVDYTMPSYYNVKSGSDFEFSGTVKCAVPINWIGILIYNSQGDEIATLNTYPGAKSCDITCMNSQFDFSTLPVGKYKILVHANNRNNDYAYLYYEDFNVGAPTLAAPEVSVKTLSTGKAIINWSSVENADNYDVRIFKSNGESYKNSWGITGTSYEIVLPNGDYYVWVCSSNSKFHSCYTYGNTVDFTVKNTTPSKPVLINIKPEYNEGSAIKFEWNSSERATHYSLYLCKFNEVDNKYEIYDYEMHYVESGYERILPTGRYKIQLQAANSETWSYADGDWEEFSVVHTYDSGRITTVPTCISTGVMTYTCTTCKATKTESVEKNFSNHSGKTSIKNASDATCIAIGYTGDTYCLDCGAIISKGSTIPVIGHTDEDTDGKCDTCGLDMGNFEIECSCMCHKTGFSKLLYKFVLIIWKLFRINKTCSCGMRHY